MATELMKAALLPAGPDMDRWVNHVVLRREFTTPGHGPCCTCQVCGHPFEDCICGASSEIGEAWSVVGAMVAKGAAVTINHWDGNTCPDTTWNVVFESPMFRGEGSANSASLAICRAALRAWDDGAGAEALGCG